MLIAQTGSGGDLPLALVVEDEIPLLEFFSSVLRKEGCQVLTARNGIEALSVAADQPRGTISLLMSDVAMPYMGGVELLDRIRESHPDLRVVLTSALPKEEVMDWCGPEFEGEFLPKPFSVADLTSMLERLFGD